MRNPSIYLLITLLASLASVAALLLTSSAFAEETKPEEWLFVHSGKDESTVEMISDTTLVMQGDTDILAFTDRPDSEFKRFFGPNNTGFSSLWNRSDENYNTYIGITGFASLWNRSDKNYNTYKVFDRKRGEGKSFNADPPNAVLRWQDCHKVKVGPFNRYEEFCEPKEVFLAITKASTGRSGKMLMNYEVKLRAGERPRGKLRDAVLFVDSRSLAGPVLHPPCLALRVNKHGFHSYFPACPPNPR